jgi:polyhydroxyalkanoate synthesis repressor PhaR
VRQRRVDPQTGCVERPGRARGVHREYISDFTIVTVRVDAAYRLRQNVGMTVRTIKRYSNRKLYDTTDSRYVTLQQIAGLIRNGDEIRVIDKTTQQDLTAATMAQIIFEEEKRGPRLPVEGLRKIIRSGLPAAQNS